VLDPDLPPAYPQGPTGRRLRIGFVSPVKALVFGAIGLAVALGIAYNAGHKASEKAPSVGECAKAEGRDHVVAVDCDDSSAAYVVTSRHDLGPADTAESACASDPRATYYYEYRSQAGHEDVVAFALCLARR
jgi:hypothetical protein